MLRYVRPDSLVRAVSNHIAEHLDSRYTEPPPWDLAGFYRDSYNHTPLVFNLSAGADPMSDLLALADTLRFAKRFEKVRALCVWVPPVPRGVCVSCACLPNPNPNPGQLLPVRSRALKTRHRVVPCLTCTVPLEHATGVASDTTP